MAPRRIAFLAYPRLTLLDLIGPYDALRRVAHMGFDTGVTHAFVGVATDELELGDETGFRFRVDAIRPRLDEFDLLVVPGGRKTRELVDDRETIEYLRSWGPAKPVASVCTGSLLLGAAGFLTGLAATTHSTAYEQLAPYCREVRRGVRVVDEGRVVTAGGVLAGVDLGLHLVEKYWGRPAREAMAVQMNQ